MFSVFADDFVKKLITNMPSGNEVIIIRVKKAAEAVANDADDDYVEYQVDDGQSEEQNICPICHHSIKESMIFDRFVDVLNYLPEEDRNAVLADDTVFKQAVSIVAKDEEDDVEEAEEETNVEEEDVEIDVEEDDWDEEDEDIDIGELDDELDEEE